MSRAAELTAEKFFEKALPHSIAKANTVADYVVGWAKIIIDGRISNNRNPNRKFTQDVKVYFIDLCCGAGAYDDGEESTPLKVIRGALKIPNVRENLAIVFNDVNPGMINRLKKNIEKMEEKNMHYEIKYSSVNAGSKKFIERFKENALNKRVPMVVFIDPFGYKEITQDLLKAIIITPQSDIVLFFNYKRINAALDNGTPGFETNMDNFFGEERVQLIKSELDVCKPAAREEIILRHLEAALKQIGANYVCPYQVVPEDESNTSYYVVCMSKHKKGYELMKGVMSQHSKIGRSGKTRFGHDLASLEWDKQHSLFGAPSDPVEDLSKQLAQKFSGQIITYGELYDEHQHTTQFTRSEYRQAMQLLFKRGIAKPTNPAASRVVNGNQTTPPHLEIEFS